jgi:quercetin dioxygenase-like cupin family protein
MSIRLRAAIVATIAALISPQASRNEVRAQAHKEDGDIELLAPDRLKWKGGPPSLPKGAMIAVLEGDPAKDGLFVFRLKLPDGYRVPPHTHPKTERVTVISGIFNIGMGDKFDVSATKAMTAGTYGYWPAGMKHFVWAKGETVLQFHGIGPWSIEYVNPKDDPRKQPASGAQGELDDLKSGPQAGDRLPGSFHSVVVYSGEASFVGKRMDFTEFCGSNPTVLVFAREMDESLADLIKELDAEVVKKKSAKLRAVVVILSEPDAVETKMKDYAGKQALQGVNLAIMEPSGPTQYKLSRQAAVTVLLYKRLRVETNHTFKKSTLDETGIAGIIADVAKLVSRR